MISIDALTIGDKGRIIGFGGLSSSLRHRLYGLGLYQGAELSIAHIAPFGCPIAIKVGDTLLSLRRDEIQQLQLERL